MMSSDIEIHRSPHLAWPISLTLDNPFDNMRIF